MQGQINLSAIYIAYFLSVMVLFNTSYTFGWRFKAHNRETRHLIAMGLVTLMCCIADPICCWADGKPGALYHFAVYFCNLLLYIGDLLLGAAWLMYLVRYLNVRLSKTHVNFILSVTAVGFIVLLINTFYPIVFSVSTENVYARGPMFSYFLVMEFMLLLDGLIIYYRTRKQSGYLKFFPIWAFLIPVFLGILLQTMFYGISLIWPCIAISISAMMASQQNELLFRDKLTGLYNRFYLDTIKKRLIDDAGKSYTAMMLDLNAFKTINDCYGHGVGDEALQNTAHLLSDAIGPIGEVIRYAGDEFIIIVSTQDDAMLAEIEETIHKSLADFNASGKAPYTLSVSIGTSKLQLCDHTIDVLLDMTDKSMYENKRRYYQEHPLENRRRME